MAPPIRTRSRFLHSQYLLLGGLPQASYQYPSEGRKNENQNHKKLTKLTHRSQPCLTQYNYEPCHVAPPKTDGSWWRVLTKCGPLEKGMANHFSILALRTWWTQSKGKKIWHRKMSPQGWQVSKGYWGRAEKQFQKEWRGWPKRKCCSAVDASGGESKVQSCEEQYCTGTWNVRSMN